MNKGKLILIVWAMLVSLTSWGQTDSKASKKISKHTFDSLVDKSISILETQSLKSITDGEHINIMYCLNTTFVLGKKGKEFKQGRYRVLAAIADKVKYTAEIIEIYTDWTPNRGMGYYFPKLKMELYGAPMPYAVYEVRP